jgi:hypothetical protein
LEKSALKKSLPGRVFISYRREDTAWPAGRVYEVLVENFLPDLVFKDVDTIKPGEDYVERIIGAVRSCDVLLALIGRQWLTITDESGHRRLDSPEDLVRLEIETALESGSRVIPILVDGARLPRRDELPATLAPLLRRNAFEISAQRFEAKRLISIVEHAAGAAAKARVLTADADGSRSGIKWNASQPVGSAPDDTHFRMIADRILDGVVVPFLGDGVNLCERPDSVSWQVGGYPPSTPEVAVQLATDVGYPFQDRTDLLRVSQYVDEMLGRGPLYELLHGVFDADYAPTPIHRLLASLPSLIRAHASTKRRSFPLIVTTNYDDVLERAFKDAGEEYDLVTYIADGSEGGKFLHTRPEGDARVISQPNNYAELRFDERPVIAKIHGSVVRQTEDHDSYVITENHYIDYLSRNDVAQLIPVSLAAKMKTSQVLFLGYSLRDWNMRVILHRLWGSQWWGRYSWAIQPYPDGVDERSWARRNVKLLHAGLREYIELLGAALISASTRSGERS